MKRKIVAALLCASLAASLLAGCGGKDEDTQSAGKNDTQQQSSQKDNDNNNNNDAEQGSDKPSGPAQAEAIDVEPLYHFALDGTDSGLVMVERVDDVGGNTGANFGIAANSSITQLLADGPVGKCTYFDGKYGIKLPMESIDSNEYTLSFWVNGDRFGDYGATFQLGHNIGMSDADNTVTWLNFTKSTWGGGGADIFPVAWNRNSAEGAFPWMGCFDDELHGKKEWIMVTLVTSGETYEYTNPTSGAVEPRLGAKFYLNGALMSATSKADPLFDWGPGVAPNIFTASYGNFEAYLGINYWDVVFKGFMDEVYVYNKALTDGQVASLYAEGNPGVNSVAPEGVADDTPAPVSVNITGTAVGATDCSTGFWGAHSEVWKVDQGATVSKTFVNYHGNEMPNNWNNFLVVLQNVPDVHNADENADYKEYGVARCDNFGWNGNYDDWVMENNWDWDNFSANLQGATVVVSVTNNGSTAEIVADATTADGSKTFQQKYSNIAVDGDLYFCLTVDGCCLDIQN